MKPISTIPTNDLVQQADYIKRLLSVPDLNTEYVRKAAEVLSAAHGKQHQIAGAFWALAARLGAAVLINPLPQSPEPNNDTHRDLPQVPCGGPEARRGGRPRPIPRACRSLGS